MANPDDTMWVKRGDLFWKIAFRLKALKAESPVIAGTQFFSEQDVKHVLTEAFKGTKTYTADEVWIWRAENGN